MEDLKTKTIFELNSEQVEDRILFLMTISNEEVIEYLLYILDEEYTLSENTDVNKAAEKFLADVRFNKFREIIFKDVNDVSDVNEKTKKFSSAPRKLRKKNKKIREKEKKEKKVL